MDTIGIELSDVGFRCARCDEGDPTPLEVPDRGGSAEWPGFCHAESSALNFGRAAEDLWFVHPRRVVHNFWARLAHEPSALTHEGRVLSYSEIAYFFLREFTARLGTAARPPEQVVLALPGAFLKDPETEEEKVGLLLGMAGELKLPLAGLVDLACAALCDPRSPGFNHALPVIVLDLSLDGADLTLLVRDDRIVRRDFMHVPQCGIAHLLKQLTATLGNRFLRHTAFDILEDGRIEQTFFRQTKDFLFSEASECRFLINTAARTYEMIAKRDQLVADSQSYVAPIVQGLQSFLRTSPHASEPCTIALTDRAARLPGLEARLRAAGLVRLLRLPPGAAAAGAARLGARRLHVPAELADVPLETSVPPGDTRSLAAAPWEARLQVLRGPGPLPPPTHAILGGVGRPLARGANFTIGLADHRADLELPPEFGIAGDLVLTLVHEHGQLWFSDPVPIPDGASAPAARTPIGSGDRIEVRAGAYTAEILFAHCPPESPLR